MKELIIMAPSLFYACRMFGIEVADVEEAYVARILYVGEALMRDEGTRELIFHNIDNHQELRFDYDQFGSQTYNSLKEYLEVGGFYKFMVSSRIDSDKHLFAVTIEQIKVGENEKRLQAV